MNGGKLKIENSKSNIGIKLDHKNIPSAIDEIKSKWKDFFPESPIAYKFIDEEYNRIYKADQQFSALIAFFTLIATLISIVGLAGLAAFTTSQRVKEIGIRKVLGASLQETMILLTKEIVIISLVSSVIAAPIAYYFMAKWLNTFVYRTEINIGVFVLAFMITLIIAFLTVSLHAIKVATSNPVKALRYE